MEQRFGPMSRRTVLIAGAAGLAAAKVSARSGPATPPLKIVSVLVRAPGLTHAAFTRHWLDVHAVMARSVPGVNGFIGSEPADTGAADAPQGPIDGIASIWYADRAGVAATVASPAGKAWLADGNTFIERARSRNYFTHEHVIVPGARVDGGYKRTILLIRRPDLTHAQFMEHWLGRHAERARAVPGLAGCVFTEIDGVAGAPAGTPADLDGISESWWHGPGSESGGKVASPQADAWAADGPAFIDGVRSRLVISRERIVIPPRLG